MATLAIGAGAVPDRRPELRVLQVFHSLAMGGAETWLLELLRYFHANPPAIPYRIKCDVLLTSGRRQLLDDDAQRLGATLHYHAYARDTALGFAKSFRKLLRTDNYTALHIHQDMYGGLFLLLGAGVLPPARVLHFHNFSESRGSRKRGLESRMRVALGRKAAKVLATDVFSTSTGALRDHGLDDPGFAAQRPEVLHCGFDCGRFRGDRATIRSMRLEEFGWPSNAKVILVVGRISHGEVGPTLSEAKNPLYALEVVRECFSRDRSVRCVYAGFASQEALERMRQRAESWGLSQVVRFAGVRRDVPELMRSASVLLFPSKLEPLGMVAVEAQAASLPVLASDSVPRECEVVPGAVRFLPLGLGAPAWAEEALKIVGIADADKDGWNQAVEQSRFSIQHSASRVVEAYAGTRRRA